MSVPLAIDDFGTGYSSLALLNQFHFNTLKIDRSFISHLETDERSQKMVEMIQLLSNSLGIHTVVEGVETMEQLTRVVRAGCLSAQGYLFSKALPVNELEPLLKKGIHAMDSRFLGALSA
jgi:EAL domain-containing protein (putative c-di-GMP-specific phosphodiesterase class I)